MIWLSEILTALPATIILWASALAVGLIIAVPSAAARRSDHRLLRFLATLWIETFRGIPTLVWLFLVFFGLSQTGYHPNALAAGILAMGLVSSAFIAETYRSGLDAVPAQQWEATVALGLPPGTALRTVVLPQARPIIAAGIGSYAIHLLKETALASLIGVVEIMNVSNYLVERGANGMLVFLVSGLIYILLTLPIAGLFVLLGRTRRKSRPPRPAVAVPTSAGAFT